LDDDAHALLRLNKGTCEVAAGAQFLDISITANSISDAATLEELVANCLDAAAGDKDLQYQWIITPN